MISEVCEVCEVFTYHHESPGQQEDVPATEAIELGRGAEDSNSNSGDCTETDSAEIGCGNTTAARPMTQVMPRTIAATRTTLIATQQTLSILDSTTSGFDQAQDSSTDRPFTALPNHSTGRKPHHTTPYHAFKHLKDKSPPPAASLWIEPNGQC